MKKYLILLIAFVIAACDSGTNPTRDPLPLPTDTITKPTDSIPEGSTIFKTVTIRKTVTVKVENQVIAGRIVDRDTKKGVSGIAVCSELLGTCARPNTSGFYQIVPRPLVAGRAFANDTVQTPENIPSTVADTSSDTTVSSSVQVVDGDTVKTDTVAIVDTIFTDSVGTNDTTSVIVETIIGDDTTKSDPRYTISPITDTSSDIRDTVIFISNGTILREVPITSWGFILGERYVVQRDVSAIDSTWDGLLTNVEVVYFMTNDSLAKVVTLGKSGKYFSGFIYTLYDDSSYRKDTKIYNLFIRGKDSTGRILVKTDIESFSERFGDLQTKLLRTKVGMPQKDIPAIAFVPNNSVIPEFAEEWKTVQKDTASYVTLAEINLKIIHYEMNVMDSGVEIIAGIHNIDNSGYVRCSYEIKTDTTLYWNGFTNSLEQANIQGDWFRVEGSVIGLKNKPFTLMTQFGTKMRIRNIRFYKN